MYHDFLLFTLSFRLLLSNFLLSYAIVERPLFIKKKKDGLSSCCRQFSILLFFFSLAFFIVENIWSNHAIDNSPMVHPCFVWSFRTWIRVNEGWMRHRETFLCLSAARFAYERSFSLMLDASLQRKDLWYLKVINNHQKHLCWLFMVFEYISDTDSWLIELALLWPFIAKWWIMVRSYSSRRRESVAKSWINRSLLITLSVS